MNQFGCSNPHEPEVQEGLATWEREWREAHGLPPRNLEESARQLAADGESKGAKPAFWHKVIPCPS